MIDNGVCQIWVLNEKLSPDWYTDIEEIQDQMLEMQPCICFLALTYPPGNTGYFMATASNDQYQSFSIGKHAFEQVMGALLT